MKILHFIAYMMLPISIINNGYTMNNQMHNINNNENVLKNIEYVNSIFRILQNDSDNNLLSSTYFNMNK